MSKINTKSIILSFKLLSILIFSLIFIPFNNVMAAWNDAPTYVPGHYNTDGSYTYGDFIWDNSTTNQINPTPIINSITPKSSNININTKTITISGSGFTQNSVARINTSIRPTTFINNSTLLIQINNNDTTSYSNDGGFFITIFNGNSNGEYSNAVFFTITTDATDADANNGDKNSSNLVSTAIFGSAGSFFPSGLMQWIIFSIIILAIIIFVRINFGAKKKYEEAPMKIK